MLGANVKAPNPSRTGVHSFIHLQFTHWVTLHLTTVFFFLSIEIFYWILWKMPHIMCYGILLFVWYIFNVILFSLKTQNI